MDGKIWWSTQQNLNCLFVPFLSSALCSAHLLFFFRVLFLPSSPFYVFDTIISPSDDWVFWSNTLCDPPPLNISSSAFRSQSWWSSPFIWVHDISSHPPRSKSNQGSTISDSVEIGWYSFILWWLLDLCLLISHDDVYFGTFEFHLSHFILNNAEEDTIDTIMTLLRSIWKSLLIQKEQTYHSFCAPRYGIQIKDMSEKEDMRMNFWLSSHVLFFSYLFIPFPPFIPFDTLVIFSSFFRSLPSLIWLSRMMSLELFVVVFVSCPVLTRHQDPSHPFWWRSDMILRQSSSPSSFSFCFVPSFGPERTFADLSTFRYLWLHQLPIVFLHNFLWLPLISWLMPSSHHMMSSFVPLLLIPYHPLPFDPYCQESSSLTFLLSFLKLTTHDDDTDHHHLVTVAAYEEYQAVRGERVALACNSSHWREDSVSLVLWYRESSDVPIYTLDVRDASLSKSLHISSAQLKDRIYFDVTLNPPCLIIKNVTKSDQGLFRCRVSSIEGSWTS